MLVLLSYYSRMAVRDVIWGNSASHRREYRVPWVRLSSELALPRRISMSVLSSAVTDMLGVSTHWR